MSPRNRDRQSFKKLYVFLVAAAVAHTNLLHGQRPRDPRVILREMYRAAGGDHWRSVNGATISGKYEMGGLKGSFRQLIDFRAGRDVLSYDVGVTRGEQGTQQTQSWWRDEKGLVTVQTAPDALADAATQSYEDRNGWFDPGSDSEPWYLGIRQQNGDSFDVVQVHPPGGRTLDLWTDSATHRLARVVWNDAHQRENTTLLSDYREVNGIYLPFLQKISTGSPDTDVTMSVTDIEFNGIVARDFAPGASGPADFRFLPEKPNAIPFVLKGGMIVVNVSIDNKPPLPFIVDSGAFNVLTPEAAESLDLTTSGNLSANGVGNSQVRAGLAQIKKLQVGPADLFDQRFVIVPLPHEFTDNGKQQPIAGLLGYEVFRRFVVRIDYHNRELTLRSSLGEYGGEPGARVPLSFNGRDCFITASVDGIRGSFGIDTGDDGGITLFQAYYAAHNFPIQLPGIKSFQGGVGGNASTLLTRVSSLSIGPFTLTRPLTELHFATGGAFSTHLVAGNLGAQLFRNFTLTFDYAHRALYLVKSPDFGYEVPYNRTGIHIALDSSRNVEVASVNDDSPGAFVGVKPNDQVLAMNHHPVQDYAFASLEDELTRSAESLTLDLLRNGRKLQVTVVPRELLPAKGKLSTNLHGTD